MMRILNSQKGQSLIEMVFAMTIFTLGVVTIGYLMIDAFISLRYSTESTQARLLATEGIEAIQSIKDGGFDTISSGTHGIVLNQGQWTLTASPDTTEKFTRTITIQDIDATTKEITSRVVWNMFSGTEKSISYTTRLTDWRQTKGAANDLSIAISNVAYAGTSTELTGLTFQNDGEEGLLVTKMNIWWSTPTLLERITINGADVFNPSIGVPVESGSDINITNYYLDPHSGSQVIDAIAFNGNVGGSNFIVLFTLSDGSEKSVYISL